MVVTIGTGLPVAPLQWDLCPKLTHRFARWINASLSGTVGHYQDGGDTAGGAVKLSVKPVKLLKLSVSFSAQRDVDPPGTPPLWSLYGGLTTSTSEPAPEWQLLGHGHRSSLPMGN